MEQSKKENQVTLVEDARLVAIQDASRTLGKVATRQFTDMLKTYADYIDPAGKSSSSKGKIYPANFKKLLRAFGLTQEQAQAKIDGLSIRDIVDITTLDIIRLAEFEATNTALMMMERHSLRAEINASISAIFEKWAAQLRHLSGLTQ